MNFSHGNKSGWSNSDLDSFRYTPSKNDQLAVLTRLIFVTIGFVFISFLLSDLLQDKIPISSGTLSKESQLFALGKPNRSIATLEEGSKLLLLATEGNQAFVITEQPFSQQLTGIVSLDATQSIVPFDSAHRFGLFFRYDPIFAYLMPLLILGGYIYFIEFRQTDAIYNLKAQWNALISKKLTLEQDLEKRGVQIDVLKQRHHRELLNTTENLKSEIQKANNGVRLLEIELKKNEEQVNKYEKESEKNVRMILELKQRIDEEIASKESTEKKLSELQNERESYRTEVVRVTHMLNHKKMEVAQLKKEIGQLRINQKELQEKNGGIEGSEKEYGKVLRLQGKVSMKAIRSNFRTLTRMIHPDKFENEDERTKELSNVMFAEVKTAFDYFKKKYGNQ